ncbi:hypothetical protein GCM10023231_28570 [Olivibacter ginsenosidimutans]|uniref:Uncharacterized protein n=1 Tax=Olivibacter ginsenosidimutans TaxID=1176537 RepID=A0ABP9BNG0_9SPHI
METLKFKTSLDKPSALKEIAPLLKGVHGLKRWTVDFDSIYNLLIVEGIGLCALEIINSLQHAGFMAMRLYEEG